MLNHFLIINIQYMNILYNRIKKKKIKYKKLILLTKCLNQWKQSISHNHQNSWIKVKKYKQHIKTLSNITIYYNYIH
jgi:hypothetical protein